MEEIYETKAVARQNVKIHIQTNENAAHSLNYQRSEVSKEQSFHDTSRL